MPTKMNLQLSKKLFIPKFLLREKLFSEEKNNEYNFKRARKTKQVKKNNGKKQIKKNKWKNSKKKSKK